jgi:hypothetical protein
MNLTTKGVGNFKMFLVIFFVNYINSFHKTEDLIVILGCPTF